MRFYILLWFFLICSALCVREIALLPDGKLHMYVFDVGQGDAIFFVTPSGKQILVDAGPDTSVLSTLGTHMSFFDRTIDLVVLTHPDLDHRAGLPSVFQRYAVDTFLTGNMVDPSVDIDLGDGVVLDIVWPTTEMSDDPNNASIVFRVLYKHHAILLTGDIEEKAEQAILASGADISADVLKVAHHGSKTSTSTGFLLAVDPREALISAGRNNRFGHPHHEVLDRLHHFSIQTETTPEAGTISRVFD